MDHTRKPTVRLEVITPDIAEEMLGTNHERQRSVNERIVLQYAHDMTEERWPITGDTIKEDWNGRIIDGQHRLRAIIKSGATIETFVARGLDPDVFADLDQGRKRSFHTYLEGLRVPNASCVGAAVSKVLYFSRKRRFDKELTGHEASISINDLIETFDNEPGIVDWSGPAKSVGDRFRFSAGTVNAVLYVASLTKSASVEKFVDSLSSGLDLEAKDPVYALRNILLDRLATRAERRFSNMHYTNLFVRAWNAYARGDQVGALKGSIQGKAVSLFDPYGLIDARWPLPAQARPR